MLTHTSTVNSEMHVFLLLFFFYNITIFKEIVQKTVKRQEKKKYRKVRNGLLEVKVLIVFAFIYTTVTVDTLSCTTPNPSMA